MEKKQIVATIYNRPVQTKAEARADSEKALKAFLKSGGVIQESKSRRAPKTSMSSKSSRGFISGTSGFATGFPRRTMGA